MLIYPQFNPVAFTLGPLKVHWYGLMYLLGFGLVWLVGLWRTKRYHLQWTSEQISDLIFSGAVGAILGGRIGYMIFYQTTEFIHQPWIVFKIWEGGMSFHGGLLGVLIAMSLFAYKTKKSFLEIGDFVTPLAPLGLAAGRIGNFINGELWGRVTDVPWAMKFPMASGFRHPSQLYEVGLEGIALFIVVWWYAAKPRPTGCISAIFLIGYALARMISECFREPDVQIGFLAFQFLTMGQLLSIPMLIGGLLILWVKRHETVPSAS